MLQKKNKSYNKRFSLKKKKKKRRLARPPVLSCGQPRSCCRVGLPEPEAKGSHLGPFVRAWSLL